MNTLRPPNDSVTIVTTEIAKRLVGRARVVLCGAGGSRRASTETIDGMEHIMVPTGPDVLLHRLVEPVRRLRRQRPERPFFAAWAYYLPFALRVAYQLRRRGADIVHVQSMSQFVPVVHLVHPRAKIVLHMHCEWLSQLDAAVVSRRLRKVDLVVGCSEHVTRRIRAAFPEWAHKCVAVTNGSSPEWALAATSPAPERAAQLLFVGRVSPEKGVHVLLDALPEIAAVHPEVRLKIVGPEATLQPAYIVDISNDPHVRRLRRFYEGGAYGDELRRRIPPGQEGQVSFVGHVPLAQLVDHYARSAVLVHPSLSEAYGVPLLEAMAMGVPVVASRVGGIPEIVDHEETGLLVEPDDPAALAAAVLRVLGDGGLAAKLRMNGRRKAVALFSWDRVADTVWAAYAPLWDAEGGQSGRGEPPSAGVASTAPWLQRRRA